MEYNDGWDLLDTPAKGTVTKIEKDEGVFTIEGVLMADQNEGADKDVAYEAELNTKDKSVYVKTDDDTYTWLAPHFLSCSATLEITEK